MVSIVIRPAKILLASVNRMVGGIKAIGLLCIGGSGDGYQLSIFCIVVLTVGLGILRRA